MENEKIEDSDRDALRVAQGIVSKTQLAMQRALLDQEEVKQAIVDKYVLHPSDSVLGDGTIKRG